MRTRRSPRRSWRRRRTSQGTPFIFSSRLSVVGCPEGIRLNRSDNRQPTTDNRHMTDTTNTYGLTRNQLLEIDYYLRLTRTLEERLVALFRQAKVIGGLYRSLGQEGESVAAAYALDYKQGDVVQPLIRNIGSILVAGAKPADIIKQYMAKADGPTRGRELNIHFGHPARDGFIGQISMLGDMIPVMAGIALAGRMQKRKLVTLEIGRAHV